MRTLLLVLVTFLAGAASLYFGQQFLPDNFKPPQSGGKKPDEKPGNSSPDGSSDNIKVVSCSGRLEPESEIIGVGGPTGSRIARFGSPADEKRPLREGDFVKK